VGMVLAMRRYARIHKGGITTEEAIFLAK
jgi:hypothetical protein